MCWQSSRLTSVITHCQAWQHIAARVASFSTEPQDIKTTQNPKLKLQSISTPPAQPPFQPPGHLSLEKIGDSMSNTNWSNCCRKSRVGSKAAKRAVSSLAKSYCWDHKHSAKALAGLWNQGSSSSRNSGFTSSVPWGSPKRGWMGAKRERERDGIGWIELDRWMCRSYQFVANVGTRKKHSFSRSRLMRTSGPISTAPPPWRLSWSHRCAGWPTATAADAATLPAAPHAAHASQQL